jgi:hypothetical protein
MEPLAEPAESRCPICLEGFDNSNSETKQHDNRCGHPIHRQCLLNLMRTGGIYHCSICRTPFGEKQNESHSSSSSASSSCVQLKRYERMLKQNHSIAIVRQRMEVDQISPLLIDSFLSGGVSSILQGEESEGKSEIAKIEEQLGNI